LRNHPVLAYCVTEAVLLLVVLWGPTPAFRNIWWILLFALLLAFGVTMLRRETAREFPAVERDQSPSDSQAQRAGGRASPTAPALTGGIGRVETLERLAALRDSGAITTDEYQAEKAHVMHNGA
jgi:hypothetical protein